jgi:serine protease AprX
VAAVFLAVASFCFADSKTIRLRNEHIPTAEKSEKRAETDKGPRDGLFLIQFIGPAQSAWVEELRQRNVSLVRYVPDDAWIARASGVKLNAVEQLPFVRWTGAFRPEHKVHGGLRNKAANNDVAVSVVLATDSAPQQLAGARGLMKTLLSESTSRFGRVWRGVIARDQLNALAASDAVLWIERAPQIKLFDETASKIVGGDSGGHATYVQSLGYDGSGVVVSVADSGLHLGTAGDMHPDLFGRVDSFLHYGSTLVDASDEHSHGTHVAGIVAGNGATGETDDYGALWGLGVAPGAHLVIQRLFDADGAYTPDGLFTFELLTRDATTAGADIGSNSWGDDTQGRYDISAMEFDALVRDANHSLPGDQPYILEFSAGNAGPGAQTIGSPAVAKNVIATGASQNNRFDYFIYDSGQEAMADFSSRGPAEDGRIKPDVVAPGTWIASLRSPLGNDEFAWADISFHYLFQGGTSQAGPAVSGAAAIFVQWYRDLYTNATPSPALVKAALINSAVDMSDEIETDPVPNNDEGWGRVDLTQIIGSDRVYDFVDQSITLSTGQQFDRNIVVADQNVPLFVTLAYTDVPGFPGALPALVNDLDLEVLAPDGRVYRGNQFLDGESLPDSPARDNLNNVECVFIGVPVPGPYVVGFRARRFRPYSRARPGLRVFRPPRLHRTRDDSGLADRCRFERPAFHECKCARHDATGGRAAHTDAKRSCRDVHGQRVYGDNLDTKSSAHRSR